MEEFDILRKRVVKTEIIEDSSDNEEDCSWNLKDPSSSSCDSPSSAKATKKDAVCSISKGGTRPKKSKAKQPRRSSDESSVESSVARESSSPKPKGRREKSHRCSVCEASFTKRRHLDSHILTHLCAKSYECNACRKSFHSERKMRVHACSAAVDEPSQFTVFRKGYSRKGHLVTLEVEKSDARFVCSVCGLACVDGTALNRHKRVHTGERPYQCYVCDKSFAIKSALNIHMRTHTGEKPYECTACGKRFARKDHLDRHVLVHTREKLYRCTICGNNYSRRAYLGIHVCGQNSEKPKRIRIARNALFGDLF